MQTWAVRNSSCYSPSLARISSPLALKRMRGNIKGSLCYSHNLKVCVSLQRLIYCDKKESLLAWSHEVGNQSLVRLICYDLLLENIPFGSFGKQCWEWVRTARSLYYSARAAITEWQRLGDKQQKLIFSQFWRLEVQDIGVGSFVFSCGVSCWLADGCLHPVSSRGPFSVHTLPWCLFLFL